MKVFRGEVRETSDLVSGRDVGDVRAQRDMRAVEGTVQGIRIQSRTV